MASYRYNQSGRSDYYKPHSYNLICDRCGFKIKKEQAKKEWTGLVVCDASVNNCFEVRHPLDFMRSRPDNQSVPFARPETEIIECFSQAIVDIAVAECTTVEVVYPGWQTP